MKKRELSLVSKVIISVLSVLAFVLLWYVVSLFFIPLILPPPLLVFQALLNILSQGSSYFIIFSTFLRLFICILTAFVVGTIMGILSAVSKICETAFRPLVILLRTAPTIAIIVLILIIFTDNLAPFIITFLIIFPIVYESVKESIKSVDAEQVDVYRLDSNFGFSVLRYVYLPLICNSYLIAFNQCIGLGFKVLVMSEYLSQTDKSIGKEIFNSYINIEYDYVFAWSLALVALVLLVDALRLIASKIFQHVKNNRERAYLS